MPNIPRLCVQDTAGAVPFVPGTPGNSPLGQGFPTGAPSSLGQGFASRGTDGQAVGSPSVGSPPSQACRGDDSAKAGPSQGIAFTQRFHSYQNTMIFFVIWNRIKIRKSEQDVCEAFDA